MGAFCCSDSAKKDETLEDMRSPAPKGILRTPFVGPANKPLKHLADDEVIPVRSPTVYVARTPLVHKPIHIPDGGAGSSKMREQQTGLSKSEGVLCR